MRGSQEADRVDGGRIQTMRRLVPVTGAGIGRVSAEPGVYVQPGYGKMDDEPPWTDVPVDLPEGQQSR